VAPTQEMLEILKCIQDPLSKLLYVPSIS
jgi:hypothetical protein